MEVETIDVASAPVQNETIELDEKMKTRIKIILLLVLLFGYVVVSLAQTNLNDINYVATSSFVPTVKDAIKFSDIPDIKDTVKKIENIKYGINDNPLFPKYQVQSIDAAKMQNEPLTKLYSSLLKVGYGPFYSMPYGEFWAGNRRSRDRSFGAHLRHLSSATHLQDVGYGGFSENSASVFGKQFYRKHTLTGDFNYDRQAVRYYGYDTSLVKITDKDFAKQVYQLFEPKVRFQSHFSDSTHLNYDVGLAYYNLTNLYRESENSIKLNALTSMFINKEKLNIGLNTDFYNHKQGHDTLNDLIVSLSPSFEAGGKKWHAEIGLSGTLDNFKGKSRVYAYPKLNVEYDVFEGVIIPYGGISGGLIKNSMRSLTGENPFVDTTLSYVNTNNKYNFFGGLKGNISSNTSYDARVTYSQYDSMYFYMINYGSPVLLYNQFDVVYDNASLMTVGGQLKYRFKEKINLIAKGNYYLWTTKNLTRAYSKPDFDMTFTGVYNMQSKIIIKANIYVMGAQWAFSADTKSSPFTIADKEVKAWVDGGLEVEYRYSKMLSFFARFNNIANQRYYRWERYPTQKFNGMIGLTFVPF
jgi:hypothetical protein